MFWLSFDELQDLYTLNFLIPFSMSYLLGKSVLSVIGYYIVVYPVFALILLIVVDSVILWENLKALMRLLFKERWIKIKSLMFTVDHALLQTIGLVVIFPLAVAFATANVDFLWRCVWSVDTIHNPGSTSVCFLMKKCAGKYKNKYKSPFSHIFFVSLSQSGQ